MMIDTSPWSMVILFMSFTLVRVFRSYIQFYRAECITVSGFLINISSHYSDPKKVYLKREIFHSVEIKMFVLACREKLM